MEATLDLDQIVESAIGKADYGLLINGQWRQADNGATFPVTNPATGTLLAHVPEGRESETRAAIDAAAAALPAWSALPALARADLLRRVAALMLERRERLATIMTL